MLLKQRLLNSRDVIIKLECWGAGGGGVGKDDHLYANAFHQ